MFAVPSLISLYLMASVPSVERREVQQSDLQSDSAKLFKVLLNTNKKWDQSASIFNTTTKLPSIEGWKSDMILVTGRQWYWDYGLVTHNKSWVLQSNISSHMLNTRDVFHLLQLDQWLFLSGIQSYTFAVTSGDVLHSFAIPTLGIKVDAVPGKDNTVFCTPIIPGLYFGNCSEICGVNHSVIPIGIVVDNASNLRAELYRKGDFRETSDKAYFFLKDVFMSTIWRCVGWGLIVNQTKHFCAQH